MSAALQIEFEIATAMDPATPHQAAVVDAEVFLVRRLRAGDERAYATLMRAHGARLLAVARRMLRHEEDARDVVQEAWLQAFRALPRFEGQARLSTWLHRIVVNAALMKLRTQRRRPEAPLDESPSCAEHGAEAAEDASAEDEVVARRLGTTAGAVKTRLHRARQALREAIEREHAAAAGLFAVTLAEVAA